jgi:hypothetical protein
LLVNDHANMHVARRWRGERASATAVTSLNSVAAAVGGVFRADRHATIKHVTPRGLWALNPQGPTIVGTGNGTPEVPELPSAWGYSWATLSPGVTNTER